MTKLSPFAFVLETRLKWLNTRMCMTKYRMCRSATKQNHAGSQNTDDGFSTGRFGKKETDSGYIYCHRIFHSVTVRVQKILAQVTSHTKSQLATHFSPQNHTWFGTLSSSQ